MANDHDPSDHDPSDHDPSDHDPSDHGSSIDNDAQYEALRNEGMSKGKAARIANSGRSTMDKTEVIDALRSN